MTYQTRSPSELTDAELVEAIDYWEEYRDLVSDAEPILAVFADEQRRRLIPPQTRRTHTARAPAMHSPGTRQ